VLSYKGVSLNILWVRSIVEYHWLFTLEDSYLAQRPLLVWYSLMDHLCGPTSFISLVISYLSWRVSPSLKCSVSNVGFHGVDILYTLRPAAVYHLDGWMTIDLWLTQCTIIHILATHIENQDWLMKQGLRYICLTIEAIEVAYQRQDIMKTKSIDWFMSKCAPSIIMKELSLKWSPTYSAQRGKLNWRSSAWFYLSQKKSFKTALYFKTRLKWT